MMPAGRVGTAITTLRRVALRTRFEVRGIRPGKPDAQAKLEKMGLTFSDGYHAALETEDLIALGARLGSVELEFAGFAFEGAGLALTFIDHLSLSRRSRFAEFLAGLGDSHAYMLHVGAGWAYARLPWLRLRISAAIHRLDPMLRWLAVDGFGFHEGYFSWQRVGHQQRIPSVVRGYGRRAFDHGLGRSIWFQSC